MAEWPAGLPAPQKKISITPGDTRVGRLLQSGRTEYRRFGNGKPDRAKMRFRLTWAQWETFKHFYERDINLSLNWFTASWLADLGYSSHSARFLSYPHEVASFNYYVDIVCDIIIQETTLITTIDTAWPAQGPGVPGASIPIWAQGSKIFVDVDISAEEESWANDTEITIWNNLMDEGDTYFTEYVLFTQKLRYYTDYYGDGIAGIRPDGTATHFIMGMHPTLEVGTTWSFAYIGKAYTAGYSRAHHIFYDHRVSGLYNGLSLSQFGSNNKLYVLGREGTASKVVACTTAAISDQIMHLIEVHCDPINGTEVILDGMTQFTDPDCFPLIGTESDGIKLGYGAPNISRNYARYINMVMCKPSVLTTEDRSSLRAYAASHYGVSII